MATGTGRSSAQDQKEKNDHIERGDGRGGHDRDKENYDKFQDPQAEQSKGHRKNEPDNKHSNEHTQNHTNEGEQTTSNTVSHGNWPKVPHGGSEDHK